MAEMPSRREFVRVLLGSGALCTVAPSSNARDGASGSAPDAKPVSPRTGVDKGRVEAELRRRARRYLAQRRLAVDYYRIGRRLAYPLPLTSLSLPNVQVPGIPGYPWATWLSWTLEERVLALGWVAEWFKDREAQDAAAADLAALAQWPQYAQYAGPDLCSAHLGRVLWTASARWRWVEDGLRCKLHEACRRLVDRSIAASGDSARAAPTKEDILRRKDPHNHLHNIGLISTAGTALAAVAGRHRAATSLSARLQATFGAVLELRAKGFSEGLAYDGYVLDFVADWLSTLPDADRRPILDHPNLNHCLEQSYMLAAPGAAQQVAQIGDVEPREMPHHLSAQAKLAGMQHNATLQWHLARCPVEWLRTDGLAALRATKSDTPGKTPPHGASDAHYAAVLRTGWETDDVAVAVSCTNSPMDHIPCDNGTLVLGTQGKWLIADPGYQQYAQGDERDFTVGPAAHNAPVINGSPQTTKRPRRIALEDIGPNLHRVAVDLAACYPPSTSLTTLVRHVWLSGKNLVVVADQMEAKKPLQATYHWHGDPASAWWFEDNWAILTLDGTKLFFTCPQAELSGANLHRLPGSRGQLSLACRLEKAGPVVWWAFVLGNERPVLHAERDGRQIRVLGQTFRVPPG